MCLTFVRDYHKSVHGIKEYHECAECGKLFDAENNERTAAELELPLDPTNHSGGETACDEHYHYTLCACGEATGTSPVRFRIF